jgi:GNAT superfamily N-acetyltransferase
MSGRLPALSPVVPLAPTHQVGAFTCGDADIDQFLRQRAALEQTLRLSQIYVTVDGENRVVAFFTLSPIAVRIEPALLVHLQASEILYPAIGGFLLGRLGVDQRVQRNGIGEALVMRAAQIAKREATFVGGAFLAVDPKTDRLANWYASQDFVRLSGSRRMVLPFDAVP